MIKKGCIDVVDNNSKALVISSDKFEEFMKTHRARYIGIGWYNGPSES